ncbi:MAG: LytR family transcriptional regulator [Candidatus Cloacimonadota bacterium]|nr:MAG: LytR family transcriptional regulator [Candidatus Cloacimonadota bacterium]
MKKSKRKRRSKNLLARITIFILTFFVLFIAVSTVVRFLKKTKQIPGETGIVYTRVEVLNGCGVDNLAYKVTLFLREEGFDVVEISNVKGEDVERTIIIERVDKNMKNAKLLGKIMKCSNITTMIDSTLFLEVTLLLGNDYNKYFSKKVLDRKIF